jgi:hypothetical protein
MHGRGRGLCGQRLRSGDNLAGAGVLDAGGAGGLRLL